MYQVGDRIIYGAAGVCEVVAVGPVDMRWARKDVDYYTLAPVYQDGRIFIPVDTSVRMRPVLTKEEAMALIRGIPDISGEVFESSNPRLVSEHYQLYLKSGDCLDLVRLVRSIYAKGQRTTGKRRLGQVDEAHMKRAEELLHNELASALEIAPTEVRDFITRTLEEPQVLPQRQDVSKAAEESSFTSSDQNREPAGDEPLPEDAPEFPAHVEPNRSFNES